LEIILGEKQVLFHFLKSKKVLDIQGFCQTVMICVLLLLLTLMFYQNSSSNEFDKSF